MIRKIFAILLVFSSLLFVGCKKATPTNAAPIAILSADGTLQMTVIRANLANAQVAAKLWKDDAQLVGLVLKISPDITAGNLTETFVFGSPQDPANWWTYSISEKESKIVRSLTPREDYLGNNLQPIKEDYLKTSYIDAIKAAEAANGANFRAKDANTQINVLLTQANPNGWLWWQIEYQSADSKLKILVSADNGKVYNVNGEPI
ncbi:MAG: hypothetical protein M1429_01855 [Patescibacteria group bacterium]|nr:hypothetical protein [Patescibacteria group bacterium]